MFFLYKFFGFKSSFASIKKGNYFLKKAIRTQCHLHLELINSQFVINNKVIKTKMLTCICLPSEWVQQVAVPGDEA